MIVSFCGSQSGMTDFQKKELAERLSDLNCSELVHGDCIGADREANDIALGVGVKIFHLFPSTLRVKRAYCWEEKEDDNVYNLLGYSVAVKIEKVEAPLIRNKKIVDASDTLIACPKEHEHTLRSGTWATIRYAWKRKKNVIVIPPIVRDDSEG